MLNPQPCKITIQNFNGGETFATAIGDAYISIDGVEIKLSNALYVPEASANLMSTLVLTNEGARVIMDYDGATVILTDGGQVYLRKNKNRTLIEFEPARTEGCRIAKHPPFLYDGINEELGAEISKTPSVEQLWHERLGHPGRDKTRKLQEKLLENKEIKLNPNDATRCHECIMGKSTKARMGIGSGERAQGPLDLVHIDLVTDISGRSEYRIMLVAVDDFSGYTHVKPLATKAAALSELQRWVSLMENQVNRKLKALRSDNGGEWESNLAYEWQTSNGIQWQKTAPYTSLQNGRVERMNRSIQERMRALLAQRALPKSMWPFAAEAAAFLINLTPNVDNKIPYEAMYGRKANRFINLLRVFGSLAWVHIPKSKQGDKMDIRSVPAILVGYSEERKCWKFYSPLHSPSLFWSNSAKFLEDQCWKDRTEFIPALESQDAIPGPDTVIPDLGYSEDDSHYEPYQAPIDDMIHDEAEDHTQDTNENLDVNIADSNNIDDGIGEQLSEFRALSTTSSIQGTFGSDNGDNGVRITQIIDDPMDMTIAQGAEYWRLAKEALAEDEQRRKEHIEFFDQSPEKQQRIEDKRTAPTFSLKYWNPAKQYGLKTQVSKINPVNLSPTLKEALAGPDAIHWNEAIRKELEGLEAMGTWKIVDRPAHTNVVGSKMILKVKTDADQIPVKYKARFVAQGFSQKEGVDFEEIFAPVAPIDTIRCLLAVAAVKDWEVDSVDVVQAYLNSTLHHDVYLKPPDGSKVPPDKVYKLVKGLYGLKQSGREWNVELDRHLRRLGFMGLSSAPCVYVKGKDDQMVVITAYVDDMLIISPSRKLVDQAKQAIHSQWKIEDKGEVDEFLGIKITRNRKEGIIDLDQSAYIRRMAKEWLPNDDKSWTPMSDYLQVDEKDETLGEAAKSKYQKLTGMLLWLANTVRPDICFAVGSLARFMSRPSQTHMNAAIKTLKYLNQTAEHVLRLGFAKDMEKPVVTYTDANWASDKATNRKSTSGSLTTVFGSPVGWRSHVQKCVALSAVEAEFVAASEAAREALFFKYLIENLGFKISKPRILTDNTGCIRVSKDPAQHWKLKHIDTRYQFIRDHVREGSLEIKYIGTRENLADIFTKPTPRPLLALSCARTGIIRPQPLRGPVEDSPPEDISADKARRTV